MSFQVHGFWFFLRRFLWQSVYKLLVFFFALWLFWSIFSLSWNFPSLSKGNEFFLLSPSIFEVDWISSFIFPAIVWSLTIFGDSFISLCNFPFISRSSTISLGFTAVGYVLVMSLMSSCEVILSVWLVLARLPFGKLGVSLGAIIGTSLTLIQWQWAEFSEVDLSDVSRGSVSLVWCSTVGCILWQMLHLWRIVQSLLMWPFCRHPKHLPDFWMKAVLSPWLFDSKVLQFGR